MKGTCIFPFFKYIGMFFSFLQIDANKDIDIQFVLILQINSTISWYDMKSADEREGSCQIGTDWLQ